MRTTENRMLKVRFTHDEHLKNAAEMARLYDATTELEATHKQIKAKLKEEEEALTASLGRMSRLVRDKFDYKTVECQWSMNRPGEGQKTLIRQDTFEDVETLFMDDNDKQESLPFSKDAIA